MARDASLGDGKIIPSFRGLVAALQGKGFRIGRLRDTLEGEARPDVMLRHDVDHQLDKALHFAELEAELGLSATYYLLPPGDYKKSKNYYGRLLFGRNWRSGALKAAVRKLTAMGHEVGLHTDLVQMASLTGRMPQDLLAEELAWLRKAGADVIGTAAHGSAFARRNDFVNYEIFEGLARNGKPVGRAIMDGGPQIKLHSLRMADFGLRYEAYHLPRGISLSDSGGKLKLLTPGKGNFDEYQLARGFQETFLSSADTFRAKPASLLFHPEWWSFTG